MKTAEEWVFQDMPGVPPELVSKAVTVVRAIQADALEAAIAGCRAREREVEHCADMGDLGTNPVTDVIMVIDSLIPTAPGTPPPGEPSKSQPRRTSGT